MAAAGTVAGDATATTNATRTLGAFVASVGLHALILAAIGAILVGHGTATAPMSPPIAVLLKAPAAEPAVVPPVPRPVDRPTMAAAPKVAAAPETPAALPEPSRYVVPWAQLPARPPPPSWMFDRPMVADGVEMAETRNVVLLGEQIERKIFREFAVEPAHPVVLRSPDHLGYPLEAIEAGVEGRVVVWIAVDEEGKVYDASILDGPPVLAEWVASRLNRLVEKPARDARGEGVPGWVALEIDFTRETAARGAIARDLASPSVP